MDFSFSEEQQMLLDTTQRFIAKEYGFEKRQGVRRQPDGFSREIWQGFADLGLLAINVPEEHGGLGGGPLETMLVMSALGAGLVLEPYLSSAVLASRAVSALGTAQQCAALLPALAAGEQIAVLAHDEPATRYDWSAIETRAWPLGEGYVLTGHKSVLPHGTSADLLLVTTRLAAAGQQGPLAVFAVPRDTPGLRRLPYTTVDGIPACELWLDQVFVPAAAMLGERSAVDVADGAEKALGLVLDAGLAAICAEAVGALDKLLAATIQYAKDRKQFGSPIAKFQALQHRMADMVLHIEQARSMAYLAAVRCEDEDAALRSAAMSAAKVVIGQACRFVGQQAVQLHGGMGVTDELDVSHFFKRLMAIELQFGSADHHLEKYAAQLA
ncbi:acyl-CoA dehydrogenase family protein [Undibacterium sp. TJN25]|uniref:acyl-CoA dehydrogenase family protein n=1 Tax=Undibacterium sp. TJN25 TaxID=3413056 RepID=UPI003BEF94EC